MNEVEEVRRHEIGRGLLRSAELGRSVIAMSPNGVLVVRENGRIRLVNEAFRQIIGTPSVLEGKEVSAVVPIPELRQMVRGLLEGRVIPEVQCDYRGLNLLMRSASLLDGGALIFVENITKFRRIDRLRRDFVANVSHELRTPIAAILGFSETALGEPDLKASLRPMLKAIYRNGRRLGNLFEDLLRLTQIEARSRDFPRERVRLRHLLAEALVSAADQAALRQQDFRLYCKRDLEVWANPESLGAVVANLAANACRYTPDGGSIIVRVSREGDTVYIDVIDDGIGISPKNQERIFERFFRVDRGRARSDGGTGLGLAMVKHLVQGSGCKIEVQSELGEGSRFRVQLNAPFESPGLLSEL